MTCVNTHGHHTDKKVYVRSTLKRLDNLWAVQCMDCTVLIVACCTTPDMFHAVWFIIRGFWRFLLELFYTTIAPYTRWRLGDIMIHSATWTEIIQQQCRVTGRNGMPCRKLSKNPIRNRRYLSSDGNRMAWNLNVTNYDKYACSGCIACWTVPSYSAIQGHGIEYADVLLSFFFFEGQCKGSFLCSNPQFGCQLFSKSGK